jgi:hypothetical protein
LWKKEKASVKNAGTGKSYRPTCRNYQIPMRVCVCVCMCVFVFVKRTGLPADLHFVEALVAQLVLQLQRVHCVRQVLEPGLHLHK